MDYRRLQHSYPPRPSPLGTSEPRVDRHSVAPESHGRRPESDKPRAYPSANSTPSPSQIYHSTATRGSLAALRGDTLGAYIPSRQGQAHRRHGSLEFRNHTQTHRRNNSQPHTVRNHEVGLLNASVMNHTPHDTARRTSQGSSGSPGLTGEHRPRPEKPVQPSVSRYISSLKSITQARTRTIGPSHLWYSSNAASLTSTLLFFASPICPVQPHTWGPMMSRDVPSSQAHRPGSSMSISAMLGSEPERSAREPVRESGPFFSRPSASSIFGNAPPSSSSAAMSPPTAPARPSPLDNSLFRRSQTPEKPYSRPQGARTYRSGSGGGSSLLGAEQSVFGGLTRSSLSQYPEKPHSTHPSPRISTADTPYTEPRRMSLNGPIARPSSQPPQVDASTRPPGYSPISQPGGVTAERAFESGPRSASGSYATADPQQHGRFGNIFGERRSEETAQRDRERAPTHAPEAKPSQSGPFRYGSHYGEREPLDRHQGGSSWDHGRSHPPSPENKRYHAPDHGSTFGFGAIQSYTKSLGSQPGGNRQPAGSLQSQNNQPTPPPQDPYSRQQSQLPRLGTTPSITASTVAASTSLATLADEGRRKGSEELLHHRNLLAVGADGKRGGRASPLPQAVQGAQAPFIGPSGETAIKNELGRVFSGIGSGVGGVGATTGGSGQSTPLGSSPFKRDSLTGRSMNGEPMDEAARIARPSSASGRRSRKTRDEEQMEIEANDPRGLLSARNARRSRHAHHHHHHHHHHRHKADEEAATLSSLHRPTNFHRTSPADPAGHHHHHHHHHHPPRQATIPAASPIREPRITVTIEPIVSSVSHLPRHHLGSTLYTPRVGAPTAKSSVESSKFGYTTTPQPLPRFEQRENCTFTVRVPRWRINQSHREEICARRAIWGTGVYTDDSDPVAAAIHSGFIRGAWGEDVDESMLDLEIKDTYQHAPPPTDAEGKKPESEAKVPRIPPVPPADKDLHITLLVLPRVNQYDSTLLFGLKSRKWDGRHDGMSFKVHAVDWVDEGVGRGEERGGEARRKRLRTLMQTGRICTGPAMAKMNELRRTGVQVPRSMETQDQAAAVQLVS
ncbi:uncharacterized protein N7506_008557 [Penicillium brevicompactum]|uniref:uncharacterized protein n=1 Tax=Penicillium brevicompactum TaxID=5074 RepID=UPI0025426393|nr:uncharacterized protein N7506_008557 [Penicillium brevicompactum]KAJ5325455.1 hypothetical protein N7506_008557 [Penicillium brevicompactum]